MPSEVRVLTNEQVRLLVPQSSVSPAVVVFIAGVGLHLYHSGTLGKFFRALTGTAARPTTPAALPAVSLSLVRELAIMSVVAGSVWGVEQFDRRAAWTYAIVLLLIAAERYWHTVAAISAGLVSMMTTGAPTTSRNVTKQRVTPTR
jgi:hypothetical protein